MSTPALVTGTSWNYGTAGNLTTSCTVTYPSGSASGDYIIVEAHVIKNTTAAFTVAASGGATWTQLAYVDNGATASWATAYYGAFRGSETGVTITPSTSGAISVVEMDVSCVAFQGSTVDSTTPVLTSATNNASPGGATTAITSQSVTTTAANSVLLLYTVFENGTSGAATTYSSGPTEIFDTQAQPSGSAYYLNHSAAWITVASPSTTGTYTITPNHGVYQSAVASIAIQPSGGGGGGGGGNHTVTLTGSGNWTVPTNVFNATVECIGGGGSAAQVQGGSGPVAGPGAAGGSYAKKTFTGLTPGGTVAYSVGAGGAMASSGFAQNGGASWFSSNSSTGCVAIGGAGGATSSGSLGPGLGTTTGCYGSTVFRGGNGGYSTLASSSGGAGSGGGAAGPGGQGGDSPDAAGTGIAPIAGGGQSPGGRGGVGSNTGTIGEAGQSYGGGAGGSAAGASATSFGAYGGIGTITVTYTVATVTTASDAQTGSENGQIALPRLETFSESDAVVGITNLAADLISAVETAQVTILPADSLAAYDSAGQGLLITASDNSFSVAESDPSVGLSAVEASATTESMPNGVYNAALDSISAADLSALVFGVLDTASESDSAFKQVGINTPTADLASGTENAQVGIGISASDAFSALESAYLIVKAAETAVAADQAISKLSVFVSDNAFAADVADTQLNITASDTFSGLETLAQIGFPIFGSDAFSAAESARVMILALEQSSLAELVTTRPGKLRGERIYYVTAENRTYLVPDA